MNTQIFKAKRHRLKKEKERKTWFTRLELKKPQKFYRKKIQMKKVKRRKSRTTGMKFRRNEGKI